jgi:hypothetical protein
MPRRLSFTRDSFESEFNVVRELEQNLSRYAAPEDCQWLSMKTFPGYLLTAVDTCRAHCLSVKTPSRAAALVCCIDGGLRLFYENQDIETLLGRKTALHLAAGKAIDSESVEMAAEFFRDFPLGIPGTISKARRANAPMPPEIKKQVTERATELGLEVGQLGVLCIMNTISSQTVVHPKHAALARDTVASFLRGVRLRCRVAEVFLEEIEGKSRGVTQ